MAHHQLDVIDGKAGFEGLRAEWTELLHASRSDSLFLTWEWLDAWWRHLGGNRELSIVTVREGETLVGIAPFVRRGTLLPSVELMGTGSVGSDYLDVIAHPEAEPAVVDALIDLLARQGHELRLRQLATGDTVGRRLALGLDGRGWTHSRRTVNTCPWIDLAGHDWDSYLATLSSSHRYNFRRRLRQLEREYDMVFERVEGEARCAAAIETLIDLHRLRWDDKGGSNALHHAALCEFHRDFAQEALRQGWLRLYLLHLDGRPAAALYGFRYGNRFLFYQSGFDPEFSRRSPSLVVLGLTIERALAEGVEDYDLLHGRESYKFHWASRERELEDIECHPPGPVSALARAAREQLTSASGIARQILPQPVTAAITRFRERRP